MADYTTHTVGSYETFSVDLGDGDTFENHLIDIRATGANYDIQCDGSGWTFRNVGVIGTFSGGHTEPFRARVPDSGGSATIENVYMADGNNDSNATGLYVYWNHAGHLDIINCNFQHWTDNAIYASGPGNPDSHSVPGSHGTVHIIDCYSKYNSKSNFRLGTDGSKVDGCVAGGGSTRGHWQFYNNSEVIDSHIDDGIYLGDAVWDNNASVDCTNSYWDEEVAHGNESTSNINGTSQGTPQDFIPTGVPTDAEMAASGDGGGSAGGLVVGTAQASNVTEDSATIRGYVDDMGDHSSADIWLEWREAGTVSWNKVAETTVSSEQNVSETIHGLDPWTEYEFRAMGDAGDDERSGDEASFRTLLDRDPLNIQFSGDLSQFEGDTGGFGVSNGQLVPAGSGDSNDLIWRPDMETAKGNTYTADITHTKSSAGDVGLLFGVQPETEGWGSFRGYFILFETDDDEVRLERWSNGDRADFDSASVTLPLDEQTMTYIDYRDTSDSTISVTVEDSSGSQIASVSLDDTEFGSGYGGFYRWHADGGWSIDSFETQTSGHTATVNDGSGEQTVNGLVTDRGRVKRMYVNHNDGNGEQLVFEDGG